MLVKLIFLLAYVVILTEAGKCKSNLCPKPPKIYEDYGCKPVKKPGQHCPYKFKCPKLESDKCIFNDKSYDIGQRLGDDGPPCTGPCHCRKNTKNDYASFVCPIIDCARHRPGCLYQKDFKSCCYTNSICDKNEIDALPVCYSEGKMYRKGELIYPSDFDCYRCLCSENYSNSTAPAFNPSCQRINCGLQVRRIDRLQQGCVPIYREKSCCPYEYRCPADTDTVVKNENFGIIRPRGRCHFGKLKLRVGDSLNQTDKCTKCSCRIPPLVECTKANN